MRWKIILCGIEWDDGDGEYDVSSLPENVQVTIADGVCSDEADAIDYAMSEASDDFGSLIAGTDSIQVEQIHLGPRGTRTRAI